MSNYKYDVNLYDLRKKDENTKDQIEYMLIRTMSMFKWNNLPSTIPQRSLELFLQCNGSVIWQERDDNHYIYTGGLGGEPDYLYRPTLATIANPAQNYDANLTICWDDDTIENECVVCMNDTLLKGLIPIHRKYASQMSENELSIWLSDILSRMPWLLSAQDDKTQKSAEQFLANIFEGKLGVVTDSAFLDGIKEHVLNNGQHQTLASLIQLHQYYKASWFNELGLNAMQNGMKKEAISDSEENMNADILKPLVDTMLKCRQEFCELINKKYGLDVSVELNSSWEDNEIETELEQEALENEVEDTAEGEENENINGTDTGDNDSDDTNNDDQDNTDNDDINDETEEKSEDEIAEETLQDTIEEIKNDVEEILEEVKEEEDE